MKKFMLMCLPALLVFFTLNSVCIINNVFSATYSWCGPSGGVGGKVFSDGQKEGARIIKVIVHSGAFIDSIQVVYGYKGKRGKVFILPRHGGEGGEKSELQFAPDEYITMVAGQYDVCVNSLMIKTSKNRKKKWGMDGGKVDFIYNVPTGSKIIGFFGRAGEFLDSIGVIIQTEDEAEE